MSEEDKTAEGNATKLEELDVSDLVDIVKALRKENAARRVKDNELASQLKEYEEWKTSQLSELEKAKKERDDAVTASRTTLIDLFADKYNVPEDRRKFLSGQTREEIEEAAKVLGNTTSDAENEKKTGDDGSQKNDATSTGFNLFPGASGRGTAVGSNSNGTDFDLILRDQLRKA